MGDGHTVLLGLRMKREGEGKGLLGERQEGESGEGEGGTQVPVYTVRWGLGAVCWPGCREERTGVRGLGTFANDAPTQETAQILCITQCTEAICTPVLDVVITQGVS